MPKKKPEDASTEVATADAPVISCPYGHGPTQVETTQLIVRHVCRSCNFQVKQAGPVLKRYLNRQPVTEFAARESHFVNDKESIGES
jgi:hypothetical protein